MIGVCVCEEGARDEEDGTKGRMSSGSGLVNMVWEECRATKRKEEEEMWKHRGGVAEI